MVPLSLTLPRKEKALLALGSEQQAALGKAKMRVKWIHAIPDVAQQDYWHLWCTGTQVQARSKHSGLRIQHYRRCSLGHNCDPWLENSICHGTAKKKKKKKKKEKKKRKEKEEEEEMNSSSWRLPIRATSWVSCICDSERWVRHCGRNNRRDPGREKNLINLHRATAASSGYSTPPGTASHKSHIFSW